MRVKDLMKSNVVTVTPDNSVKHAAQIMLAKRVIRVRTTTVKPGSTPVAHSSCCHRNVGATSKTDALIIVKAAQATV